MEGNKELHVPLQLLLLACVLAGRIPGVLGFGCPRSCNCFSNNDAGESVTVDCSSRDLSELPYPLPNRTSHLYAIPPCL